jgi:hypothetical protein
MKLSMPFACAPFWGALGGDGGERAGGAGRAGSGGGGRRAGRASRRALPPSPQVTGPVRGMLTGGAGAAPVATSPRRPLTP